MMAMIGNGSTTHVIIFKLTSFLTAMSKWIEKSIKFQTMLMKILGTENAFAIYRFSVTNLSWPRIVYTITMHIVVKKKE